jgi:Putative transposase
VLVDATDLAWQRTRRDRQPILRHRTATTDLEFDPVAFLERLAVLVPRPRVNLILYHGVLAARAAGRSAIVPRDRAPEDAGPARGAGGRRR